MNLIQGAGIRFGELSRALVKASRKMQNPVLIELTRGRLVESTHSGAIAVVRADGEIVAGIGDTARPVFPRSAIKPLQAFPFLETGAVDRFGFGEAEIAIACASHTGTSRHTGLVAAMLQRAGLSAEALGCGTHEPTHAATQRALIRSGAHALAAAPQLLGQACGHAGDRRASWPSRPRATGAPTIPCSSASGARSRT